MFSLYFRTRKKSRNSKKIVKLIKEKKRENLYVKNVLGLISTPISSMKKRISVSKKLGHKNLIFKELDLMTFPAVSSCNSSLEKLHILGFIDSQYNITNFGFIATKFSKIKLENIRLILSGYFI